MKKILFLLLALSLFSCHRRSDFEKRLVKGEWAFMMEGFSAPIYYRFYEDGTYKCSDGYGADCFEGVYSKPVLEWEYSDQHKKLKFLAMEFNVISFEDSIVHLTKNGTKFTLRSSPNFEKGVITIDLPEPLPESKEPWHCEGG